MAARLLETPPVYCSACWCQDPSKEHVDYNADNDQGYGDDPAHKVPYDNLQLCETCVKDGARLLGMTDDAALKAENADLKRRVEVAEREADKQAEYASRLEGVFDARPEPIKLDHRRKPRQREKIDA